MKVVIDLDKLREEGKITKAEYDKLSTYAMQETGFLAFNLLVGFGVIAVTCSSIALVPTAFTAIICGFIISALGYSSPLRTSEKWQLFSKICMLLGTLLLSGGILWLFEASVSAWIMATLLLIAGGIIGDSGLLIVLAVFSLSATIGSGTFYDHAMYWIIIDQPAVTVLLFTLLGVLTYILSLYLSLRNQRLAILASRASLFIVNMGFWVGSLWGDRVSNTVNLPDWSFALVWAALLVAVGIWASRVNRAWVLNVCAVFAGIHFYTQWFERLGATPATVLLAGVIALAVALVIKQIKYK